MLVRRALLLVCLWPLLTGAACVRMLYPPPPQSAHERLAELQETAKLFEMMSPKGPARDGVLEGEIRSLKDQFTQMVENIRQLLYKSIEHEYRLKQVEGVKK